MTASSKRYTVARETKRIILTLGVILLLIGIASFYMYAHGSRELLASPARANITLEERGSVAVTLVRASTGGAQVKVYYDVDGECNKTIKAWEDGMRIGETKEFDYDGRLRLCGVIAGVKDPLLLSTLPPRTGYYESPGVYIANFSYPTISAVVKVESRYKSLKIGYRGPVEVVWQRGDEKGKFIVENSSSIDFASVGGWVNWYEVYVYKSPPWTVWFGIAGFILLVYYVLSILHERRIINSRRRV